MSIETDTKIILPELSKAVFAKAIGYAKRGGNDFTFTREDLKREFDMKELASFELVNKLVSLGIAESDSSKSKTENNVTLGVYELTVVAREMNLKAIKKQVFNGDALNFGQV